MADETTLFLHEEIMLLALRDDKGTIAPGTMYQYAIGGAILAELLLLNRIGIDESRGKKLVRPLDPTPVGESLIDECLDKIHHAKRRASLQTWVARFAGVKRLKHRAAEQLCRRGILRVDENNVLLVFTRTTYPEANPEPERLLIERLGDAIFSDTRGIDPRTVVTLSLANSAGLLRVPFEKKRLKDCKKRIAQITSGELTGRAAKEAIEAMQAAIMVAVIIPAIVTPTVTS